MDDYWKGYNSTDDMIKEAIYIWKSYQTRMIRDEVFRNMSGIDRLKEYHSLYQKFHRQFPIVMRYMIEHNRFYVKAFTKYVEKLSKLPVRSMDEKMERQAEYIAKYLYREEVKHTNSKYDSKYAKKLKTAIYEALKKEKEDFEKKYKESQEETTRCIKLNNQEKRKELLKYLKQKLDEQKT